MSCLIEIFLPVVGDARFGARLRELRGDLASRFGGVTLFVRAPAPGEWKDQAASLASAMTLSSSK